MGLALVKQRRSRCGPPGLALWCGTVRGAAEMGVAESGVAESGAIEAGPAEAGPVEAPGAGWLDVWLGVRRACTRRCATGSRLVESRSW